MIVLLEYVTIVLGYITLRIGFSIKIQLLTDTIKMGMIYGVCFDKWYCCIVGMLTTRRPCWLQGNFSFPWLWRHGASYLENFKDIVIQTKNRSGASTALPYWTANYHVYGDINSKCSFVFVPFNLMVNLLWELSPWGKLSCPYAWFCHPQPLSI